MVLNTVTNERQVDKVNAFALSTAEKYDNLIPFCSVHPLNENIFQKLTELKNAGIKGIKHHPDYVGIMLDDERMHPLLQAASDLELPMVIHAGFDPVSPEKMHATPDAICNVIEKFPNLTLIVAHMGGVMMWEEVIDKLCGKNVWLDTAFCCERIGFSVELANRIFERHDIGKILFGSDAPWAKPSEIIELLNKSKLSQDELDAILYKNAKRLFGI